MLTCLLCDGPLGREVFPFVTNWDAVQYRYRSCTCCGSATIDPLPNDEQIAAMYRWSAYHQDYYRDLAEDPTETRLERIMPALADCRTLLDFGCGNGNFLKSAKSRGLDCKGVELDQASRRFAADNSGCSILSLEEVEQSGGQFDVIHLGDVLEHLREPDGMLRRLEPLLGPSGKFFIEGPIEANASLVRAAAVSFGNVRAWLGQKPVGSLPPYHLFQATADAQHDFFVRKMSYDVDRFEIWETGWPYYVACGARSGRDAVRNVIGRAAIALARAGGVAGLRLGNRFAAVMHPVH